MNIKYKVKGIHPHFLDNMFYEKLTSESEPVSPVSAPIGLASRALRKPEATPQHLNTALC